MTQSFMPPEHFAWVTPYLTLSDPNASIEFYKKAFGFEEVEVTKDDTGAILHAQLNYRNQAIMMGLEGAYQSPVKAPKTSQVMSPVSMYLYTDNVDSFFARAKEQGAVVISEVVDAFWGDRMCSLQDLEGYLWCVATPIPDFDPARINEIDHSKEVCPSIKKSEQK